MNFKKHPVWTKAIKASADPERARHFLELLAATSAEATLQTASAEQARMFCALLSGSHALSAWLVAHSEFVARLSPELLQHQRRYQGLRREIEDLILAPVKASDYSGALAKLREFKQREMLRIAARDLARLADVTILTRELSDVADTCLEAVWQLCNQQLEARFGRPYHQDVEGRWQTTTFCVLGMGKLGGQELNYSSDVDVLFVYAAEGQVFKQAPTRGKSPPSKVSNHEFFKRLAEMFIAEVSRATAEGMLYRIDLRLRPEGDAGPLARSLESYENFYAQWGQTWERMMLVKARGVAGDAGLAAEFLELIQPFRYPRSVSSGVLREVAAVKDRIETEVLKSDELERDVKRGRGGIREIEFIAQSLQLLRAGKQPFLQGAQTLPVLEKLAQYDLLSREECKSLTEAYIFLRDVEHRLQMEDNLQVHAIPTFLAAQDRLAALMGFASAEKFEAARKAHCDAVRRVYDRLLRPDSPARAESLPREIEGNEAQWKAILAEHSFKNVEHSVRLLNEFVFGPGYGHVSNRTVELALELVAKLLALCPKQGARYPEFDAESKRLSDPDRVLTRLAHFITVYGARATLFELWAGNPSLFELLVLLFDRSEFLAEVAIRTPDLVDELELSGRLRQRKTAAETLEDLRHGRGDADQRLWLRRYHQAEQMRIGLRDILGLADFEQNLTELSALADACLQYALEAVLRARKIKSPPFVIIGMGKLGGAEINYGSDLDLIFVSDAKPAELPRLQALAIEVMEMISARTEQGAAFATDARLRPDGEKGLLVNTIGAYEEYYRQRAQLWEIQALTRTRPVAGDMKLGDRFQEMVKVLTDFAPENVAANFEARTSRPPSPPSGKRAGVRGRSTGLAAYTPEWKVEIHRMRLRVEKERTPPGQDALAIKTGKGGLMDAEFLAQTYCLEHGWQEANTLRALERAQREEALAREDAEHLIANYRKLRRLEGILRRWSFEGETALPDEDAPYYRVSIRCGFAGPEQFRDALAHWRTAIRAVYQKQLGSR